MSTSKRSKGRGAGGRRRLVALAALAASAPLAFAACSSSSSSTTTTTATTTTKATTTTSAPSTTSAPTTTAGTTPQPYEVKTGTVSGLGTVLVDGQGLTLYLFVPDKQSGTSTCYSTCAEGWPPLILPTGVAAPLAGAGVQSSLLGTTHRTDGTTQITYNKWPLYLWQGDSEPGQATGQALNNDGGLWYVLAPDGHTITTQP